MKKRMIFILAIIMLLLSLTSCRRYEPETYFYYVPATYRNINYYYDYKWHDGFIKEIVWDGNLENTTFEIPNEIDGNQMYGLGGVINADSYTIRTYENFNFIVGGRKSEFVGSYPTYAIRFTIKVSANIREVSINKNAVEIITTEIDGSCKNITYNPIYYFECDPNNEVFYAKDGKLYYKKDNSLAYVDQYCLESADYLVYLN